MFSLAGVTDLWDHLFAAQPDPPGLLVLLTAVAGLLAVAFRPVWRIARNAVTIAHEGGHALFALLTGRRLRGIRLEFDTSGLTLSAGRPTGFGMILTLLGGYLAPSLIGVLGAWLLGGNRITLLLWLAVLLLLATLVSLTTRASDMLASLERALRPLRWLGVSPVRLSLLLSLTLRFIPLLATWLHEIREAQRVRGLESHPFAVLVPLLVKTLRTADQLADAIDARCFDPEEPS